MKKIPEKVLYILIGVVSTLLVIGGGYGVWALTQPEKLDSNDQEVVSNDEGTGEEVTEEAEDNTTAKTDTEVTEENTNTTTENTTEEEEKEYWDIMGSKIEVEKRKFVVEYRKGDGGYVQLEAKMPTDAEITLGGGTSAWTKLTFSSLGSEFTFQVPHFSLPQSFTYPASIENENIDNLYRALSADGTGKRYYVTNLVLDGECDVVDDEKATAPCGPNSVEVSDGKSVTINFVSVDEYVKPLGDKVMETLKVVE